MRQEIIADEKAKEHEIVDKALKVKSEGQLQVFELQVKVLAHD